MKAIFLSFTIFLTLVACCSSRADTVTIIPPKGKPPITQESINLAIEMYQITIPPHTNHPLLDLKLNDRGLTTFMGFLSDSNVTIGPAAFTSWATLGSTLAHELEVHCVQDFRMVKLRDLFYLDGTGDAERAAYNYEISQRERFKLSDHEVEMILKTSQTYYPEDKDLAAKKAP